MRKIFTIAAREYRAMVATKAFMISMAMMPLLMFGGILAMEMLENVGEISDQKIVIIDGSNQLMEHLQSMAEEQNRLVEEGTSPNDKSLVYPHDVGATNHTGSDELDNDDDFGSFSRGSRYKLIAWEEDAFTKQDRLELSERIRRQELYAFVEIPVYAFESSNSEPIKFYSEDSNFSDAKSWIARVINDFIHKRRLTALGVDLDQLGLATAPVC